MKLRDMEDDTEIRSDGAKLDANDIHLNVTKVEYVSYRQLPNSDPEKKTNQREEQLHSKEPDGAFKVPTMPNVKPAINMPSAGETSNIPTAGDCANTLTAGSGVMTSAEHSEAAVTGYLAQTSNEDISHNSPSSVGFAIPSSVAHRVSAIPGAKQPRCPDSPLPKTSTERASGGRLIGAVYRPPAWSGSPPQPYSLEVLRGGRIVDTVSLQGRPCTVFGRLPDCDVQLEHPSISRHHAALVYR